MYAKMYFHIVHHKVKYNSKMGGGSLWEHLLINYGIFTWWNTTQTLKYDMEKYFLAWKYIHHTLLRKVVDIL